MKGFSTITSCVVSVILLLLVGCGRGDAGRQAPAGGVVDPAQRETHYVGSPPSFLAARLDGLVVTIIWNDDLPGDYNVDRVINGMDVFPLAVRFGQHSDYNGFTAEDPSNNCVDGNRDGTLNGLDLFVITAGFGKRIDAYEIEQADSQSFDFEPLNAAPIQAQGCGATGEYDFELDSLRDAYFRIRSLDESTPQASSWSNTFSWADRVAPEWVSTVGIQGAQGFESSVELYWNTADAGEDGPVRYNVYYSADSPVEFDGSETKLGDVQPVEHAGDFDWQFEVEDLDTGTEYHFAVRAENSALQPAEELNREQAVARPRSWHNEIVDSEKYPGRKVEQVFDNEGNPLIAYGTYDSPTEMRLARRQGELWSVEVLPGNIPFGWVGLDVSSTGVIGAAYDTDWGQNLTYAWNDGTGWQTEIILNTAGYGATYIQFEFDNDDIPIVLMTRHSTEWARNLFWVMTRTEEGWESVSPAQGWRGDLVIGEDDRRHLGLHQMPWDELWYAVDDGSGWRTEVITEEGAGWAHSIDLRANGAPVIGFLNGEGNGNLRVASLEDLEWKLETVTYESDPSAASASMRLDPFGAAYYVYQDLTAETLQTARRYGGIWRNSLVVESAKSGKLNCLEFNRDGNPTVCYNDWPNQALGWAEFR